MQATFRIELILFRSSLDKGEHHVDIAGATPPTRFYPIEVIGIAFGWWKAEEIMERTGVPSPEESIGALKSHFEEVSAAFQPAMLQHTLKKLEHADTLMQEAMSKHWAGLQKR